MTNGKWSKDVQPNVIARAREVSAMSHQQAMESLRAAQMDVYVAGILARMRGDPLVSELVATAARLPALARRNTQVTIPMFYLVHEAADDLARWLGALADDPGAQRTLLANFEKAASARLEGKEVLGSDLTGTLLLAPEMGRDDLRAGLAAVRAKWTGLTPAEKLKLVGDIFDSDKGYGKTARSAPAWMRPRDWTLGAIAAAWLNGFSNTSIFTALPLQGEAPAVGKQIAGDWKEHRLDPEAYCRMWGSLLDDVDGRLALRNNKEELRAFLSQNAPDLYEAFRQLPISRDDIDEFLKRFDEVWAYRSRVEDSGGDVDSGLARTLRIRKLKERIPLLVAAVPLLRRNRFESTNLADQLALLTPAALGVPGSQTLALMTLRAELGTRAREKLRDREADLSTVELRRLDGAVVAEEMLAECRRDLEAAERG